MSRYLSKEDLRSKLGISMGKVELMMKDGLRYVKFGRNVRFKEEDVEKYLENYLIDRL